jgi:hypothetical protein
MAWRTWLLKTHCCANAGSALPALTQKYDCHCTHWHRQNFGFFATVASEPVAFEENWGSHHGSSSIIGNANCLSFEFACRKNQLYFSVMFKVDSIGNHQN